jgi:sugar lactone lactonase YvrE
MKPRLLGIGVALALAAGLTLGPLSATARPGRASTCHAWHVRTLLSGQGWLESLAFDGRGGMTISALAQGRILRLTRGGHLSTLLGSVSLPGGQIVSGRYLYFTTRDGETNAADGTIVRFDLRSRRHTIWARGLTGPNGLAFLPGGDAVVTRDLEAGAPATDVTRVPARRPRRPRINWARIPDSNGVAVDPSGKWLYLDRSFTAQGLIVRVRISHPSTVQVVGRVGAPVPDDMSIDRHGILWIAGFGPGEIFRLDPRTHASCAIATGLVQPTAVVNGGHGWPAGHLFVTSAAGFLYELTPPRS